MGARNRYRNPVVVWSYRPASLCSLTGRYDNPIPTRFLAAIDCSQIPAQGSILESSDTVESEGAADKAVHIKIPLFKIIPSYSNTVGLKSQGQQNGDRD
jgi:hypothetical protein